MTHTTNYVKINHHNMTQGCLQLEKIFNSKITSTDHNYSVGRYGYLTNLSIPAEELFQAGIVYIADYVFLFPDVMGCEEDCIEAEGQEITVKSNFFANKLIVLGATDTANFTGEFTINNSHQTQLGLTHLLSEEPEYNNLLAWQGTHLHNPNGDIAGLIPRLWISSQDFPVTNIHSLKFPLNPSIHIFSITIARAINYE
jgi:hypothetical protein